MGIVENSNNQTRRLRPERTFHVTVRNMWGERVKTFGWLFGPGGAVTFVENALANDAIICKSTGIVCESGKGY